MRKITPMLLAAVAASSAISFAPHAGKAEVGKGVPPEAPKAEVGKVTEISTSFALPAKTGRGGGPSPYKFDDLAAPTVDAEGKSVLASFGVVGKTRKNMNSNVHSANKRYRTNLFNADGTPQMTTKKIKGRDVPVQAFTQDRKFEAFDVNEPDGVTVRVFRTK